MKPCVNAAVLAVTAVLEHSQVAAQTIVPVGYAFGSPAFVSCCGESNAVLQMGGGSGVLIGGEVGVTADVTHLAPFGSFSEGIGLLDLNGTYHFGVVGKARRTQPFVTVGYTLGFGGGGTANLWNVGAGVDYWFTENAGFRSEIRDHLWVASRTLHFWGPRFGVVFRGK
jgi:hypothetical protein